MSLKKVCPCDDLGYCPYGDVNCEDVCFEEEPQDDPELWEDDCDYEVGYDPYLGCFSDEV